MIPAFRTWKHGSKVYLAVPCDAGVHVLSECGENFGSWVSTERFRALQAISDPLAAPLPESRVMVQARAYRQEPAVA